MRYSEAHRDYRLLDCGGGERLEDWNGIVLIRPDPQVIWEGRREDPRWKSAHARYIRSSSGGGSWQRYKNVPESWRMRYGELTFSLRLTGFKHTGVFPEQAVNWDLFAGIIKNAVREGDSPFRVLNLFAYTGCATAACLAAGAEAVHVDAAAGMVSWARENAALSGLGSARCRWLVDDCVKFVEREIRRGNRYQGIIMDPPSYGRGPNGEVWQLESRISSLINRAVLLLGENARFFAVNSYTAGIAPSAMGYILSEAVRGLGGRVECSELGLPVCSTGLILPCGSCAVWSR